MKTNVMLDLETLGKSPGAVIVAIGAVKFGGGQIHQEFYERIDAVDCELNGLRVDAETVMWWLKQSEDARSEICRPGQPLNTVLEMFHNWLGEEESLVWGNGTSFDNALLVAAYKAAHMDLPWKFWNDRCYRTVKALRPEIRMERSGTHHNALDDAKSQALHLMEILTATNIKH